MRKQNIMDIYIKDLDGNYYDINSLKVEGNDVLIIEIKRPHEDYRKPKHWITGKEYFNEIEEGD